MKIYVILYKIKQKNLNGKKYDKEKRKENKEIIEKKDIEKKGKKERK